MNYYCEKCSTRTHFVYHKECPKDKPASKTPHIWIPDDERPIEKADRYLIRSGLERKGAKGWI